MFESIFGLYIVLIASAEALYGHDRVFWQGPCTTLQIHSNHAKHTKLSSYDGRAKYDQKRPASDGVLQLIPAVC
jgi:hypothetical protein